MYRIGCRAELYVRDHLGPHCILVGNAAKMAQINSTAFIPKCNLNHLCAIVTVVQYLENCIFGMTD